jgi:hypothetical protein
MDFMHRLLGTAWDFWEFMGSEEMSDGMTFGNYQKEQSQDWFTADRADDAYHEGNINSAEREAIDRDAGFGLFPENTDVKREADYFDRELNEAKNYKEDVDLFGR